MLWRIAKNLIWRLKKLEAWECTSDTVDQAVVPKSMAPKLRFRTDFGPKKLEN